MEFRTSIPRTLGLAALGVLMTLASYYTGRTARGFTQAVGWFGLVFFALALVVILLQLFRRGPTVTIGESGVLDRRLGVGLIPWQDISSVSITRVRNQRFISLWLRNDEQYLSRIPTWRRVASRLSDRMGISPFTMQFHGLSPGLDDAYALLRSKLPERAGFYQSLEGAVNGGRLRAAGAGRQCAPAALMGRFWAAPQLHR
jgi:hypothetical protein